MLKPKDIADIVGGIFALVFLAIAYISETIKIFYHPDTMSYETYAIFNIIMMFVMLVIVGLNNMGDK